MCRDALPFVCKKNKKMLKKLLKTIDISTLRCYYIQAFGKTYGGVAQLGEHLPCKQGVSGSIPLISTT